MKYNVAIVSGGDSGEFEVSVNSGRVVASHIDKSLFNPYLMVFRGKEWDCIIGDNKYAVDKNDFTVLVEGQKIVFDCVFIAIHGTPGEDGKLQGYLEMLGIPFTSCSSIVSGITFDKDMCKDIVSRWGVMVAESVLIRKGYGYNTNHIIDFTGLPCFVKPNKGGSSVGMTKVKKIEELDQAIKKALIEDDEVLVEEFINGREITCGVFTRKQRLIVLPLTEIVSKREYFDYDAKYKGMADEITPAPVGLETEEQCKLISSFLYKSLKCKGVVRFDYIINEKGIYFLEVNTVPGLSEASIVPQQSIEMGITLNELFTILIQESLIG